MKNFSAKHQPRSHACDLVEAVHVVLRMYDRLTAREGGAFLVRAKKRGGGGRRKKAGQDAKDGDGSGEEQEQDDHRAGDQGEAGAAAGQQGNAARPADQQQREPEQATEVQRTDGVAAGAAPGEPRPAPSVEAADAGDAADATHEGSTAAPGGTPGGTPAGTATGAASGAAAGADTHANAAAPARLQPPEPADEGEGETSSRAAAAPVTGTAAGRPGEERAGDGDLSRGASPDGAQGLRQAVGGDGGRERAPMEELELGLQEEDSDEVGGTVPIASTRLGGRKGD